MYFHLFIFAIIIIIFVHRCISYIPQRGLKFENKLCHCHCHCHCHIRYIIHTLLSYRRLDLHYIFSHAPCSKSMYMYDGLGMNHYILYSINFKNYI